MLSIILASRVKNNPDSKMLWFLESLCDTIEEKEYKKVEVLIKYDNDDTEKPNNDFFNKYPITIKTFEYERGEGRHYNNYHCEYLFANRNPNFRWVMNSSDDFIFIRKGFLKDLEEINDRFMIVGYTHPTFKENAENNVYKENTPINFEKMNGIGDFCPIVTSELLEVCQNMGWQPNLDGWIFLLNVTLYQMYKIVLWKQIPQFYTRFGGWGLGDTPVVPGKELFNNMTISGKRLPQNKYLFKLMEQQAKNIYLNLVYDDKNGQINLEKLKPYLVD